MKALGVATMLVLVLVGGIIVWALANGSPLSGEPTASLQIKNDQNLVQKASMGAKISSGEEGQPRPEGQEEVLLDVTPRRRSGTSVKHIPAISTSAGLRGDGLIEPSKFGPLPRRSKDGRSPARAYARPGEGHQDAMPRIAILVTGLGLNQRLSHRAVKLLPGEVSLAFSAYGRNLDDLAGRAQGSGHELMLQIPLEPLDYPETDTGPKTLLVAQSMQENQPRLHWSLGRFTGYFGVVNAKGGRYLANKKSAGGLFRELKQRGLFFFRDAAGGSAPLSKMAEQIGVGYSQSTLQIDVNPSAEGVRQALAKLETAARRTGIAVGVARMHPVSIDMIDQWAKRLESRGLRLVPVSAAYRQARG